MKSKKAEIHLANNRGLDYDLFEGEEPATGEYWVPMAQARKAVEIAEQQMQKKAVEAFESLVLSIGRGITYDQALERFTQKLDEA